MAKTATFSVLFLPLVIFFFQPAEALCSVPNTLANGTTADATKVQQNFNSLAGCAAPLSNPQFTGNVGIGASAPSAPLSIYSASVVGLVVERSRSQNSDIELKNTVGSVYIGNQNLSGNFAVGFNANLTTSPALVVTPAGNVGIDTTTPDYTLHVNGSVAGHGAYVSLSDARLKKDITPITGALSIVDRLQGVRFRWRAPRERTVGRDFNLPVTEPQVGFIAQDLRAVLPEAVSIAGGHDAIMSVAESKLVPILVEAVKELQAANDRETLEIKQLQTQVSMLQRKIAVQTAEK